MRKYIFVLIAILVLCSVVAAPTYAEQKFRLTVSWTAPGDDSSAGTCAQYDMRIFDGHTTVTTNNWEFGTALSGAPTPQPGGTRQYMTVEVPEWMCEFTLNLRAADEANNWSAPSNSPQFNKPLGVPYPNPFNPQTDQVITIPCVPVSDSAYIYDASGAFVRSLASTDGKIEWDGKNSQSKEAGPGFYFYQIPALKIMGKIQIKR